MRREVSLLYTGASGVSEEKIENLLAAWILPAMVRSTLTSSRLSTGGTRSGYRNREFWR